MVSDWDIGQCMDLLEEVWVFIKQYGFFGLIIFKEYGGKGFFVFVYLQVVMKFVICSGDLVLMVMVLNFFGLVELLFYYGIDEQCQCYLLSLVKGDDIFCFVFIGFYVGFDVGGMIDVGIVCKGEWEGCEVFGLCLIWEKCYIIFGLVVIFFGFVFKCYDLDYLLGDEEDLGIILVLIFIDIFGVEIGCCYVLLGVVFMNGLNFGKDVFVLLEYIIGGQEMIGKGWMMLMNCLLVGCFILLLVVGISVGKVSSYVSGCYVQVCEQFNVLIVVFEGIQEVFVCIGGNVWLMDSV